MNSQSEITGTFVKKKLVNWRVDISCKIYSNLPQDIYGTYITYVEVRNTIKAIARLEHVEHDHSRKRLLVLFDELYKLERDNFSFNYCSLIYAIRTLIQDFPRSNRKHGKKLPSNLIGELRNKYQLVKPSNLEEKNNLYLYPTCQQLEKWGIKPEGIFESLSSDIQETYEILEIVCDAIEVLLNIPPKDENIVDFTAMLNTIYQELLFDYPYHYMRLMIAVDKLILDLNS